MRVDSIVAQKLPSVNNNGKKFLNALDNLEGIQGAKTNEAGSVDISTRTTHASDLTKSIQSKNINIGTLEVTHNALSGIRDHALMASEILNSNQDTLNSALDIDALMQKISHVKENANYDGKSVFGAQLTLEEGRYLQIPQIDVPSAQGVTQGQMTQYLNDIDSTLGKVAQVTTEQYVSVTNQLAALSSSTVVADSDLTQFATLLTQEKLQNAHDIDALSQSAATLLR